jgi:hypothetical protein
MAIRIATDQAQLKITSSGVIPGSTLDKNGVFLFGHLTNGWNGSDWVADALTCTGSVPVSGPQDELDRLEIGFVQIARASGFRAFYGGRTEKEGSIGLDYFLPPALTKTVLLDGGSSSGLRDPWYRNPTLGFSAGRRVADTGDHPGMLVRLSLENRSRSNVRNFLFHCFMDREFWTILTAIAPGGKPQYISHFHWRVRYEFKLRWQNGSAQEPVNLSTFTLVRGQTAGPPKEEDLKAVLDNPAGERANSIGKRAEATTVTGNPPNRSDNTLRFRAVPDDFWK